MSQTSRQRLATRATDAVARWVITGGGLLTIGSLVLMFLLIVRESLPLFARGRVLEAKAVHLTGPALAAGLDANRSVLDVVRRDGTIQAVDASTGALLAQARPESAGGLAFTAAARTARQGYALGLPDGRVAIVDGRTEGSGASATLDLSPVAVLELDPAKRPPALVALGMNGSTPVVASSPEPSTLLFGAHSEDEGDVTVDLSKEIEGEKIASLAIPGGGETLAVGTESGKVITFSLETVKEPAVSDRIPLDEKSPARVGALSWLLGGQTLLAGDAKGRIFGLQRVRTKADSEERALRPVHRYETQGAAIAAIAPSTRGKVFLTADAAGRMTVRNATTERTIAEVPFATPTGSAGAGAGAVLAVAMAPKADGFAALGADIVTTYTLDAPHTEVSWRSLFGKVWYEGYDSPSYVWQSSGSTDDVEPKLSFVPLVFGTLKGTVYAMLFAVPLGILAALYTSLFAPSRLRAFVKPVIEIMAALPSVVVGFLAGLWLAPMLERHTLGTLLLVPIVPAVVLAGALLFQRVPAVTRRRLPYGMELAFVGLLALLAAWVAFGCAPVVERVLFHADFKGWLLSALGLRYDTRNCLVIGFAMGIAVVPIVFTISEDALSTVPQSLKAASLALGATAWQTAIRVVLPTASAGIFSAVMLGFGRAVGETMIVLMATGNTPILDWSIFDGMRTLSANIAVEIPEAPQGGTLYRLLFLSSLLLFALTFVVNTAAELMRQRLRRKYSVI